MKKIVFIFLTVVGIKGTSFACNKNIVLKESTDVFELFQRMVTYLTEKGFDGIDLREYNYYVQDERRYPSYLTQVEIILHRMKEEGVDMNTIDMQTCNQYFDDIKNNTPLHYALSKRSPRLAELVYKYFNHLGRGIPRGLPRKS